MYRTFCNRTYSSPECPFTIDPTTFECCGPYGAYGMNVICKTCNTYVGTINADCLLRVFFNSYEQHTTIGIRLTCVNPNTKLLMKIGATQKSWGEQLKFKPVEWDEYTQNQVDIWAKLTKPPSLNNVLQGSEEIAFFNSGYESELQKFLLQQKQQQQQQTSENRPKNSEPDLVLLKLDEFELSQPIKKIGAKKKKNNEKRVQHKSNNTDRKHVVKMLNIST